MSREVQVACIALISALAVAACGGGGSSSGEPLPDLSGSITIEAQTRVDSDTADDIRVGIFADNNSPVAAQSLPSNATVGGYLSANAGLYNNGNAEFLPSRYYIDEKDVYAVDLVAEDRISFQIFSSPAGLLSSHTAPPTRTLRILKSESGGLTEVYSDTASGDFSSLIHTLPDGFESGSYLLEASTSAGMPFRYVLSLADTANTNSFNAQYAEPPFLLDQAVVSLQPRSGVQAMAASMNASYRRHLGGNLWLLQRGQPEAVTMSSSADVDARKDTLAWVQSLNEQAGVALAEPNYLYFAQAVSPDDDNLYARQWALPFLQMPIAWQVAEEVGNDVGIAVMDTGLFRSPPGSGGDWHPDLDANVRLISGEIMDYVSGELDIDGDNGSRDTNPADPGDGKAASSNFHGTHVAGIAAGVDNAEGIVGVAPSSLIYPVRVLGRGGVGSSSDLIDAINWAAGRNEIDVINLSLGGLAPSNSLKAAIDSAWNNGKLIVAAAGNEGSDQATYPAAYGNVIGVGAVDGAGVRAGYSNVGPSVDVVAPGGDASRDANQDGFADLIVSTWGLDESGTFTPSYVGLQGTSMAAPHVAGIYALMKGEVPTLTPMEFRAYLRDGALTRSVGPAFEYGAGLIDALASMDAALEGNLPVTLSSAPSALQFNSAVLIGQLELTTFPENEPVTIGSVTPSAPWLTATVEQDGPSSGGVTVSVNTSGLDSQRRYVADLTVAYEPDAGGAKELTVPVSLQLGSPAGDKDAGRHYVLLATADNLENVVAPREVTADSGQYRFTFDDVEPGDYFLIAGTDTDNNGFICESGEACAEYPVNGLPETIRVGDAPQTGITLSTSFRRPTISSLGAPRIGFEGYRLPADAEGFKSLIGEKEYAR